MTGKYCSKVTATSIIDLSASDISRLPVTAAASERERAPRRVVRDRPCRVRAATGARGCLEFLLFPCACKSPPPCFSRLIAFALQRVLVIYYRGITGVVGTQSCSRPARWRGQVGKEHVRASLDMGTEEETLQDESIPRGERGRRGGGCPGSKPRREAVPASWGLRACSLVF